MFIPLHDANELKRIRRPYVTYGLIAANILVYLLTNVQGSALADAAAMGLGFIPSTISGAAERPDDMIWAADSLTFLTYGFLHGDIFHLGGNMLFLFVFGDNVEDALGHVRYLIFYFLCILAGALMHFLAAPDSQAPLIGASGAIAGVVTAYLVLYPKVKVWVLAFARIPLRVPAWLVIIAWIIFQFVMFLSGGDQSISWAAHIGGIIAGFILVLLLRRPPLQALPEPLMSADDIAGEGAMAQTPKRAPVPAIRRSN